MSVILYVWVIAWFPVQFGKNKHESEGRVLLVGFEKPTSACFFQISREIKLLLNQAKRLSTSDVTAAGSTIYSVEIKSHWPHS